MALIVQVFINEHRIIDTHAVRVAGGKGMQCVYKTGAGRLISHHYDEGGAKLAIKLLEMYDQERKERQEFAS